MIKQEKVTYQIDGKKFNGYWSFPVSKGQTPLQRPAVVIAHAWMGQDEFARHKADALAELGYIAFAADVYGEGKQAANKEEAIGLMTPLFVNRRELQKRIQGAYDFVRQHPGVDSTRIGAIGFCFGGLTVIELLRSGADVKGVVSFHGVLGNRMGTIVANTVPVAKSIKGSLLILHGFEDPLVSKEDIADIQKELSDAKVDWQMNIYSHTKHAFTNPEAHDKELGLAFQALSSERAWWAMIHFFSERFGLERTLAVF
jgi:dienelactone hydrolase